MSLFSTLKNLVTRVKNLEETQYGKLYICTMKNQRDFNIWGYIDIPLTLLENFPFNECNVGGRKRNIILNSNSSQTILQNCIDLIDNKLVRPAGSVPIYIHPMASNCNRQIITSLKFADEYFGSVRFEAEGYEVSSIDNSLSVFSSSWCINKNPYTGECTISFSSDIDALFLYYTLPGENLNIDA